MLAEVVAVVQQIVMEPGLVGRTVAAREPATKELELVVERKERKVGVPL